SSRRKMPCPTTIQRSRRCQSGRPRSPDSTWCSPPLARQRGRAGEKERGDKTQSSFLCLCLPLSFSPALPLSTEMSIPTLPPTPDVPQVLLFGHSGSGKSALLGALLKAAETQGQVFRGELHESSGRMASIRDAVYKGDELEPTAA